MKKVLALLLAVVMVFSFAACGEEKKQVEEKKSALEGFPAQNFTMIVPVGAGAAIDVVARFVTDGLDLGAAVTIENLAGASQTIGTAEMVNRGNDGYTLGMVAPAGFVSQPLVNKDLTYKMSDFTVLSHASAFSNTTIVVKKGSKYANAEEFVNWLKTCDKFTYGLPNIGGINQLAVDQFLLNLGVYDKGTPVIYTSSAETDAAVLNGDVEFSCVDDDVMVKRLGGDQFDCVMTMTLKEDPLLPGIPYVGQYDSKFVDVPGFKAIVCPAAVDPEIKGYLADKITAYIKSDEYQKKLTDNGYPKMTEDQFVSADKLQAYFDNYGATAIKVLKDCGYAD